MREAIDPWTYVAASYAITIGASAAAIAWSWLAMHRAEARRDQSRAEPTRREPPGR